MKILVKRHTEENHTFIAALYQESKTITGHADYNKELLGSNGVNAFREVIEVPFEEDQPRIHSIFVCTLQDEEEQTQLIFTY